MAKRRQPMLDWLVYLAVRGIVAGLQALPPRGAGTLADALAWGAYHLDRRHREVARDNLTHAFPARSATEIDKLVRGCYRHFALLIAEIAVLPRKMHVATWRRHAQIHGGEQLMPLLLGTRPVLIVTAHFGNWELAGFTLGALGFRTFAIARVLDNPHVEAFLKQFRQATGQTIIAKKDDFARLTVALQQGAKVATLADQDAGPRGVFVDFLGRPASAHKAVALMALEFDAVMVVAGVPRVGGFLNYEIVNAGTIDPRDFANRPDAIRAITQAYHTELEKLIRAHPEQYFWLHRRWKTRPKQEWVRETSPSFSQPTAGDRTARLTHN